MRRRTWFDWHSWLGINFSLLMTFTLLTGTLATVSKEIDWLFQPAMRAASAVAIEDLPWGSMLKSFLAQYPGATPQHLQAPVAPWFAPEMITLDADGRRFRVFFDGVTGGVQGDARWFNWQRFFRQAHRHLMLPLTVGLTIVGLLALPLLIMFISSFFIYRRWWRGFFRLPRLPAALADIPAQTAGRQKRRFWGDLHRLAGVWTLWFVLLIALTSLWYLAERWGAAAEYPAIPKGAATVGASGADPMRGMQDLDSLITRAREDYPDLTVSSIRFDLGGGLTVLQGQAEAMLVRDRANHVAYGPTGALVDQRRGEHLGWHVRVSEAADPLHFGTLGGTPTRLLWAFFGLLLTLLSVSGLCIYGLRLLHRSRNGRLSNALLVALANSRTLAALPSATLIVVCLSLGLASALAAP